MAWRERARKGFRRAKQGAQRALYFTLHMEEDSDAYEDSSEDELPGTRSDCDILDDDIRLQRRAIWSSTKSESGTRADLIDYLGRLLVRRYERAGDNLDVDEAISSHREALSLRGSQNGQYPRTLVDLPMAYKARYMRTRDLSFLDSTMLHLQDALCRQDNHPDRSFYLSNLASTFWLRFEHSGSSEDLDESIKSHTEALALRPIDHPQRPSTLFNLTLALVSEYHERDALQSLEPAISYNRETHTYIDNMDDILASSICDSLAASLGRRFRVTGDSGDIDESIQLYEQCLSLTSKARDGKAAALGNLELALEIRFSNTGNTDDLDRAIVCLAESLETRPPGHRTRWWGFLHYSDGLRTRFDYHGQREDLDKAIDYLRQALVLVIPTSPHVYDIKIKLSMSLLASLRRLWPRL